MHGMAEYIAWLADPAKADERAAYFGKRGAPRSDWPVDNAELVQRHREIGTMALKWAEEHFRKADELRNAA